MTSIENHSIKRNWIFPTDNTFKAAANMRFTLKVQRDS